MRINRAEAEYRMLTKPGKPGFQADVRPLPAAEEIERLTSDSTPPAFASVFETLIAWVPGDPWA